MDSDVPAVDAPPEFPAVAESGDGVESPDAALATDEPAGDDAPAGPEEAPAVDEAADVPPLDVEPEGPPPLVLPEGLSLSPTCGGCGLNFAEPTGGKPCPNCGTPVV